MDNKRNITMMQACLIFLVMGYSAIMRLTPKYTAQVANQAGWLSGIFKVIPFIIIILVIKIYVEKFPSTNYTDSMYKIAGKAIGKILVVIYLLWFITLLALYLRYFGERLVSSIYATTNKNIFIIIIMITVGIMLRSGINVIARMNKFIFILMTAQLMLIITILLTKVDIDKITPISTLDILPAIKGVLPIAGIHVYLFFIFMLGNEIITNRGFRKNMLFLLLFLSITDILLLISVIGTFGSSVLAKTPIPILEAVKNISKGGKFSGLESIFLSLWILADFITIVIFSYLIINMLKSLFNLKNSMPFLSAILPFAFILCQFIAVEIFELQTFSVKVALQMNIILGLLVPIALLGVAKIRKII